MALEEHAVDTTRAIAYCAYVRQEIEAWLTQAASLPSLSLEAAWGRMQLSEVLHFGPGSEARPLLVALLGGTGVGKSTLVNALFRQPELCPTSLRRPTTSRPKAIHHPSRNPMLFIPQTVPPMLTQEVADDLVEQMIIIDCPDFDALPLASGGDLKAAGPRDEDQAKRASLDAVLHACDVLLVVVTHQKFWDEALWKEIQKYLRDGRALVVVQTHARDPATTNRLTDIEARLREHGLLTRLPTAARFLFVDSLAEFRHEDSGIDQLRAVLRHQIARNARRTLLVSRTFESYLSLVRSLRAEVAAKEAAAWELLDTAQSASRELGRMWRNAILLRLPVILPRLSVYFDDHLSSMMAGTIFGRFLNMWSHAVWLLAMFPALYVRGVGRLLVLGSAATGAVIQRLQRAIQRDTPWLEGLDLEPDGTAREAIFDAVVNRWVKVAQHIQLAGESLPASRAAWELASVQACRNFGVALEGQISRALSAAAVREGPSRWRFLPSTVFIVLPAFGIALLGKNYFWDVPIQGKAPFGIDFIVLTCFLTLVWGLLVKRTLFGRFRRLLRKTIHEVLAVEQDSALVEAIFPEIVAATKPLLACTQRLQRLAEELDALWLKLNPSEPEASM
ncbi:MAG: GTPase [Candidatus Tectimicrobiota bacterium]